VRCGRWHEESPDQDSRSTSTAPSLYDVRDSLQFGQAPLSPLILPRSHFSTEIGNVMEKFDYGAPADLYPARSRVGHRPVGYRRFDTAAHAIRYAVEEMPAEFLDGTVLEIESGRVDGAGIRLLYGSNEYPLARKQS